jgi:hypothetical protein
MSIVEICQALQDMPPATALRESQFMFPFIEGTHLLGLALMMAPVLMFDLRLIGVLWKKEPASSIRNQFLPVTFAGALLMTSTGLLLFWSEAVKCFHSQYFRIKLVLLVVAAINALIFHSTVDRKITEWENDPVTPSRAKFAGFMSILIWTGVIFAGRYTAYNL